MTRPASCHSRVLHWRALLSVVCLITASTNSALGDSDQPVPLANSASDVASRSIGVDLVDNDHDGLVDTAVYSGAMISASDTVTICGPGQDLSGVVETGLNFDGEIMLVDVGGDHSIELAVRFSKSEEMWVADVYDDRNGDQYVEVVGMSPNCDIRESLYPTVRITSTRPWIGANGHVTSDLVAYLDGVVPQQVTWQYPSEVTDTIRNDGVPDFEFLLKDSDRDGTSDYYLMRYKGTAPYSFGIYRAQLFVNAGHAQSQLSSGLDLWPLLGHDEDDSEGNYFDTPFTVDIDWARAAVTRIGLWGYPIEAGWHLNSINAVADGALNRPNFENPMAYYDLAANQNGEPELHIRLAEQLPDELLDPTTTFGQENQNIRYSWKQYLQDNKSWDFKLDLMGRHQLTTTVDIDTFHLVTVPYDQLPFWVTENVWDMGAFVAREGRQYIGTEGIYDWSAWGSVRYMLGKDGAPNRGMYTEISPGLRGDYTFDLRSQPYLYLSPIDRKLHLQRAQGGLWQIDEQAKLVYESSEGNEIDGWLLFENGDLIRKMYSSSGFILVLDEDRVSLFRAEHVLPSYITLPPRTSQEWARLGDRLKKETPNFDPADFTSMAGQFDDQPQWITSAAGRDFRRTERGFRFVLSLREGFSVGGSEYFDMSGLTSADYVVTYENGFSVQPLSPARLIVSSPEIDDQDVQALIPIGVHAAITNTGLEDASPLPLRLIAQRIDIPNMGETAAGIATATVAAGQTVVVDWTWIPPDEGQWLLSVTHFSDSFSTAELPQSFRLSVEPAALPGIDVLVPVGTPTGWLSIMLLGVGGVMATILWIGVNKQ